MDLQLVSPPVYPCCYNLKVVSSSRCYKYTTKQLVLWICALSEHWILFDITLANLCLLLYLNITAVDKGM